MRLVRRASLRLVLLLLLTASTTVLVPATAARASTTPWSGLVLRNSSGTEVREPGVAGASLNLITETSTYDGTTANLLEFNSQIGSIGSSFLAVRVSAGLAPGSYPSARLPGQAAAVADAGGFTPCGDSDPGVLTVLGADYGEDGRPTSFAADFQVESCDKLPVLVQIRWHSAVPIGIAQAPATSLPVPVVVNSVADLAVTFTGTGNSDTTLGALSVSQTPLWDSSVYWSVRSNGCTGQTLHPGASCTVTMRFAPLRPNGVPVGHIDALLRIADGHSLPATAAISADVKPLLGQPVGLTARGAFRHLVLSWQSGGNLPDWSSGIATTYRVYQLRPDRSLALVASTNQTFYVLAGLPDGYTGSYAVTASQTTTAPISVAATGTTAASELLTTIYQAGLRDQRLAPSPEAVSRGFTGRGVSGADIDGAEDLAVSRNQAVLAWQTVDLHTEPLAHSTISVARVDASGTGFGTAPTGGEPADWDTEPSLSPDGSRLVYTHASTPGSPSVLRVTGTASGSVPVDVPGSAGLSQATWSADGKALVAVRAEAGDTGLVRLDPGTGAVTVLAATIGLSQPDVAADGRIVAVRATDPDDPRATGLVLLAPGGVPAAIPAAQAGVNLRPRFSATGTRIFYTHRGDTSSSGSYGLGYLVDLGTGVAAATSDTSSFGHTPYVLEADGQHRPDQTAPAVTVTAPSGPAELGAQAVVAFRAADPLVSGAASSGVWNYDVRYRVATASRPFGAYGYPAAWQRTTRTGAAVPASPGTQYCFSVRARDLAGNLSGWTADRCTASPLDDRSLSTTATRGVRSYYYRTTYSRVAGTGMAFTRTGVTATRVGIVATTCASCGAVQVSLAGRDLGRVDLRAGATHYRQVLWLPAFPARAGTLVIRTLSNAQVLLDGVVTSR